MGLGQNLALGVGVVALGTVYVLLHEARRKAKKRAAAERDQPIAKELLLQILQKAAEHSKSVIQRIRVEVGKIKESRNLSDEQASMLFQQNFEHSLEQLIGAIRGQYGVSEKAMDASFKLHQADPQVQAAIQGMRLSAEANGGARARASGGGRGRSSAGQGGSGRGRVEEVASLPDSLTRDRLKEIMTYNAVLLEKELLPIKEAAARQRQSGTQVQVDPRALAAVQGRISAQVHAKYGVTDEQVMAAVEKFGARDDPGFKAILQRIAQALNGALA